MSDPDPIPENVEQLFAQALELEPDARGGFLAQEAHGDHELEGRVRALLVAYEKVGDGFLVSPLEHEANQLEGQRIGRFELLRLLGEGGMGAVYEARQERPQRTVALKVVRSLPGGGKELRRLEHEAEVMARLQHPNVAQVFEAGTEQDAGGTLIWFAMELVEGAETLLQFADSKELDLEGRLKLFEQTAAAVAHGHRRGVLHRDLKPENVLVGENGRVRVIDFGIARATGRDGQDWTLRSEASDLVGTLNYMSPEQCGEGDLDTRTDIFSLGVLLYELLTGERPRRLSGASITRALELIRTEDPVPPSAHRPELKGELEAVILKALERDRDQRYSTVEALSEDLWRYRRGEPVAARPPGKLRAARLFARRHAWGMVAVAVVSIALIGATVVSTAYGVRASKHADREASAREHAERVSSYMTGMFDAARPETSEPVDLEIRQVLLDALERSEGELGQDPLALAEVLQPLGITIGLLGDYEASATALRRSAELLADADRAVPAELHSTLGFVATRLGNPEEAGRELEQALFLLEDSEGRDQSLYVVTLVRYADHLRLTQQADEAERVLQGALGEAEGLELRLEIARALGGLGDVATDAGDQPLAAERYRAALEIYRAELPEDHVSTGVTLNNLASALFKQGSVDEAEVAWREALDILEGALGADHPDVSTVLGNLALIHQRRREYDQAIPMYERSLDQLRMRLGSQNVQVATALRDFGWMYVEKGDLDAAQPLLEDALAAYEAALGNRPDAAYARAMFQLSVVFHQRGAMEDAEAVLQPAVRMMAETYPPGHPELAGPQTLLGSIYLELERPEEAEGPLREAYELRLEKLPGHWLTANTQSVLGQCLADLGQVEEGLELLVPALEELERALGGADFRTKMAADRVRVAEERIAAGG